MSYVQGTRVRLRGRFRDRDTGQVTAVTEAIVTIEDQNGVLQQHTLSGGEVQHGTDAVGDYYFYDLDTSLGPVGTWEYQFESTGNEATVGKKQITVRPRLGVAP